MGGHGSLMKSVAKYLSAAAFAVGILGPASAQQPATLKVMTFGGTLGTGFVKGVEGFEAANNVKIQFIEATPAQALNRLLARVGQEPEYDLVTMSPAAHFQGVQANMWDEVTVKDVPNVADLLPVAYEQRKYVGWGTLAYGFMVNTDALKKAGAPVPSKWTDLWNPAYKGRISIEDFANSYGQAFLEAIYEIKGRNFDAAFKSLKDLRPNIASFTFSPAEVDNHLLQGETWISPTSNARASLLRNKGAPVSFIYPSDGAGAWLVYLDVPKGTPRRNLAMKFLDFVLSPAVQAKLAVTAQMGPVNTKVKLPAETARGLAYGEVTSRLRTIRWDVIQLNLNELSNRWMSEFQN